LPTIGPWIINYYDMCRAEIDVFRENYPDRWLYLAGLYEDLIMGRKKWYADHIEPLPRIDDDEELNAFLQGEHVRSHRGLHSRFIQTTNLNPPAHWHGNADDNIEGD
jgi:hypothetical protein